MSYHSERLELNPTRTFSEMMPNTCPRVEATGIVTYQLPRVIGGGILLGVLIPLHFSLARSLGRGAYCVLKTKFPRLQETDILAAGSHLEPPRRSESCGRALTVCCPQS